MGEAQKVIWAETGMPGYVCEPCEVYTTKYHHDDTVTALQAKVARLEAALETYADPCDAQEDGDGSCGYEGNMCCKVARTALSAIFLDTTTATCDNTREGE